MTLIGGTCGSLDRDLALRAENALAVGFDPYWREAAVGRRALHNRGGRVSNFAGEDHGVRSSFAEFAVNVMQSSFQEFQHGQSAAALIKSAPAVGWG